MCVCVCVCVCVKVKDRNAELTINQIATSHLTVLQPREDYCVDMLFTVFINWSKEMQEESRTHYKPLY